MKRFTCITALSVLAAAGAVSGQTLRNVTVEVRAVEIEKSALKDIGVSWNVAIGKPATYPTVGTPSNSFNVTADLKALEQRKSARTHTTSRLTTLDGRTATLGVGNSTPFVVTTYTAFGVTQSVQLVDFGIRVTVRPQIVEDDKVRLAVRFGTMTIAPPPITPTVGTIYPLFKVRDHETTIVVKDGETMLAGQFYSEDERRYLSVVPGISQVPVLGELFKRRTKQKDEVELVLFLTPHIGK